MLNSFRTQPQPAQTAQEPHSTQLSTLSERSRQELISRQNIEREEHFIRVLISHEPGLAADLNLLEADDPNQIPIGPQAPIDIKYHYAFKSDLPRILYQAMVYGDAKKHNEMRLSIKRTFLIRMGITASVFVFITVGVTLLYHFLGTFFANFYALLGFIVIVFIGQSLWFLHYRRSSISKSRYIFYNRTDARKYRTMENGRGRPYDGESSNYLLPPPPPTYQLTTLEPPSYEDPSPAPPAIEARA